MKMFVWKKLAGSHDCDDSSQFSKNRNIILSPEKEHYYLSTEVQGEYLEYVILGGYSCTYSSHVGLLSKPCLSGDADFSDTYFLLTYFPWPYFSLLFS